MNILVASLLFLLAIVSVLAGITALSVPGFANGGPTGSFATVNGTRMHYVRVPAGARADLPPLVFIHGASGNLRDQTGAFEAPLQGRADMLFVDRPGHGWSERGPQTNAFPDGQADTIAALMDELGMEGAVIVAHSFGGAIATALAVLHPDKVSGLVLLAPATHPWPGGATTWYYNLTATPVAGWLFSQTLAPVAGRLRMAAATRCVFAPNPVPDGYARDAATSLVLRPAAFRHNARDVVNLFDHVTRFAPRYREIAAPTVVISGDSDTVVAEEIHSIGLARDIPHAQLVWVKNLGHKPDYAANDLAIAAIERVSGKTRDLDAIARKVEQRIADDRFGPFELCKDKRYVPLPDDTELESLQRPLK